MTPSRMFSAAPTRIVLGIPPDWTSAQSATGAVAWAAQQGLLWNCPVVVVRAWLEFQVSTTGMSEAAWHDPHISEQAAARPGAEAAAALRQRGLDVTVVTRRDSASHALLSVARAGDLVILGTVTGRLLRHAFSANVVHQLLNRAPCAVAVVPAGWQPAAAATAIMVGFDSTERSIAALHWALSECRLSGSRLVLVRALVPGTPSESDIRDDAQLLERERARASRYGVAEVSLHDVSNAMVGSARALEQAAVGAGMLVLGNHRASWLAEISRSSVAERTATGSHSPVVIVPDTSPSPLRSPALLP